MTFAYTPDQFANVAVSTVQNNPLAAGGTSLTLGTGDGAKFPSSGPFMLLLGTPYATYEYVKCTSRSGDTLTIVRGPNLAAPDTTSAQSWPQGTTVIQANSAGNMLNIWSIIDDLPINPMARQYGAKGDGVTDDAAAINSALATGKPVYLPGGYTFGIKSPLNLNVAGAALRGGARQTTFIKPLAGWSGSELVNITADYCTVEHLSIWGDAGTSGGSQAANGVEVTAARWAYLHALDFEHVNGWAIEIAANGSQACYGAVVDDIHAIHTTSGIHILGNTAQSFGMQVWASNLNLEIVDTNDCLLIEDSNDILVQNINGAASQGSATNSMVHIKGACSGVYLTNVDLGVYPGGANAPTVLIESGSNGSPVDVYFDNGVIQAGTVDLSVTSGSNLAFRGITFKSANTHGVSVTGSTGALAFEGCHFKTNNQSNTASTYDVNITISSNWVYLNNCRFYTPVGSGAGNVTRPVNDTNHRSYVKDCHFAGTGNTPSTTFQGTPQIVRSSPGYNPRGSITPPTISALPASLTASQDDISLYFTALGGATTLSINGTQVCAQVALNTCYRIPARQSYSIGGTGTVPTIVTIAD